MRFRHALIALLLVTSVLAPELALACPVCFAGIADIDSPMATGMNNGILVLLAVIATVQLGFVAFFLGLKRRARRLQAVRVEGRPGHGGAR